jgi:hypothetical protein
VAACSPQSQALSYGLDAEALIAAARAALAAPLRFDPR